jgi:hypothetical protein
MDGSDAIAMFMVLWVIGFSLKRIAAGLSRADSDGAVKKAARDGVVRVISRLLK